MTAEATRYRRALIWTSLALGGLAVVGAVVGALVDGGAGALAGVLGAVVAALGAISTQAAMLVGHAKPPHVFVGIVAFSWLGKMLLVILALLLLDQIDGFHKIMFAATVVAGLAVSLVIDLVTLRRARIPYVEPGTKS